MNNEHLNAHFMSRYYHWGKFSLCGRVLGSIAGSFKHCIAMESLVAFDLVTICPQRSSNHSLIGRKISQAKIRLRRSVSAIWTGTKNAETAGDSWTMHLGSYIACVTSPQWRLHVGLREFAHCIEDGVHISKTVCTFHIPYSWFRGPSDACIFKETLKGKLLETDDTLVWWPHSFFLTHYSPT